MDDAAKSIIGNRIKALGSSDLANILLGSAGKAVEGYAVKISENLIKKYRQESRENLSPRLSRPLS